MSHGIESVYDEFTYMKTIVINHSCRYSILVSYGFGVEHGSLFFSVHERPLGGEPAKRKI